MAVKRKPPERAKGAARTSTRAVPHRRAGSKPTGSGGSTTRARRGATKAGVVAQAGGVTVSEVAELEELRREIERMAGKSPPRWNADPEDVQRSVAQLVLTLVEFIRKLLERQAIRRMEARTLSDEQVEDVGRALMKLEETVIDMARQFGLSPDDLNLDLGPIGKLM